jgi:acetyl-CoA carboxylase biotin carboxyl carrier protein
MTSQRVPVATESNAETPRPFDAKMVEHLVGLMDTHQLSEISLVEGDKKIRLRKGGKPPRALAYGPPPSVPASAPIAPMPTSVAAPAAPAKKYAEIKSPMVGTFYAKPAPDKPDYVSVGSTVKAETVVCKLEAMKIFNDLTADLAGVIVEVCVKNGDPVEYGTVLFRVDAA